MKRIYKIEKEEKLFESNFGQKVLSVGVKMSQTTTLFKNKLRALRYAEWKTFEVTGLF
jgi:hypothetical protein